jgi:RimJ/RimL family protein N-acetyltransferase
MAVIECWRDADLPLLEQLNGNPSMMARVGGPESPTKIAQRHARYVADAQQFRIVCDGESAGWVGYWPRTWHGEEVYEIGWSVLPEFQGRGVAASAAQAALDDACANGTRRHVHAFPGIDNAPSNALCRKLGFTLRGPVDFEYPPGTFMLCNDWRVAVKR